MTNPIRQAVEALDTLSKLGNGDRVGNSDGNVIAHEAHTRLAKFAPLIEELMEALAIDARWGERTSSQDEYKALLDAGWDDEGVCDE